MNEGKIFPFAKSQDNGILLFLHVQPGGSRDELCGTHGDSIKLKVRARAVEGAANQAVRDVLAKIFKVPKSSVTIVKGETSREKTIHLRGSADDLMKQLSDLLA